MTVASVFDKTMAIALRITAIASAVFVGVSATSLMSGCAAITGTETIYTAWRGDTVYQGQGGAVEIVDGIEIWEHGEPNRSYKVIGLITQSISDNSVNKLLFGGYSQRQITNIVLREKGDGVIILSHDRRFFGYQIHTPMFQGDLAMVSADYKLDHLIAVFKYVE